MDRIPNLLSMLRILAVPVLGGFAWAGAASMYLVGLVLTLATDVADGFIARRYHCQSEAGAKLDSRADLFLYATLPLFAWWLWPDLLRREVAYLAVAVAAFTVPIGIGWLRFGRLTSYHTYGAKITSVVMGIGMMTLFLGGPAWVFHLAVIALMIEAIEEIAITMTLSEWKSDVPTLWHAIESEREASGRA